MATTEQIDQAARTRKPIPGNALTRDAALTVHRPGREPPREFHDDAERELLTVRPYAAVARLIAEAEPGGR